MRRARRSLLAAAVALAAATPGLAQPRAPLSPEAAARRWETERALDSIAIVDRKVMVPMRDGARMATDIYRPKHAAGPVPTIFVRTPYNFNFWDVRNGVPADMTAALDAVRRGYAYVLMNERGHFFSEGSYDILGAPRTDGYDAIRWLSSQPWSNGKVGLIGCSSTAEWQMAVAALSPPGLTTIVPQGFGAGVGRVGPWYEQGNWYRGGLWHDDMPIEVPGLWFMSWYDVSVGPNLATYHHVRRTARPEVADRQYAVIAPTLHCAYKRATENTVVGERSVGDARLDYDALTYGWFDHLLKGEANGLLDTLPKVRYYTMGLKRWQSSETWPPRGAQPLTLHLASGGRANTRHGDGRLVAAPPPKDTPDIFTYDPKDPVPSHGGNVCCTGNAVQGGAFDQQRTEERPDVLVYTSEPLREPLEVSGPVEVTLYVSSDARDTDFTVKLLDVYPDGRAYNLDETIQRARYREGYDREVWMQPGRIYKVALGPLTTSNWFDAGHRIRIEVSSSNFPRFDRNLNTGGRNYDETEGVVARNAVHHSARYPSQVKLTVVRRPAAAAR